MDITDRLFCMRDEEYAAFQAKLIPNIDAGSIIGVRTPQLRELARQVFKENVKDEFLSRLPHRYFEENQLHAFIISLYRDIDSCIAEVERFLPYIDNWATCDQLVPKAFKKDPDRLLPYIRRWISSDRTYTVRFAVGLLMRHFLDERFSTEYADMAAELRSDEYYVNMMTAWYFATALAKQYELVLPYIENKCLAPWVHNKAIQKSIESRRITEEQKQYLGSLKIK